MRAYIVVDLGFGDSGKGLLTDTLVRQLKADVVVRYNGGAQAGHNVVTADGRQHTFSQFGSGSFHSHVKTYLSRHVVIHPTALLVEGDILAGKGVRDPFSRLRVSDSALVITPFHQAANRIRELARGAARHGSCGVGVGEAVEDAALYAEERILAGDLYDPAVLRRKLGSIRTRKHDEILSLIKESQHPPQLASEIEIFTREDVIESWISSVARFAELGLAVDDAVLERWLQASENVIFEGAQGVLLDAEAGFHPYTTWSNCTAANALELISEMAPDCEPFQLGVMRAYAMRHGPGPLPTETDGLSAVISEHNQTNDWQGAVRYGWFDAVLARYALRVTGKVHSLLVTHMDALSHLNAWNYGSGYTPTSRGNPLCRNATFASDVLQDLPLQSSLSLEERAELTDALSKVSPVMETCPADENAVLPKIESIVGQQIGMISRGPRAEQVQLLTPLPH